MPPSSRSRWPGGASWPPSKREVTDPIRAIAAALQAVDGVALKVMVDRWAQASGEARARAFEGAVAVRQIEVGVASLLSVAFGLTVSTFGVSMRLGRQFPQWLAWLGLAGG